METEIYHTCFVACKQANIANYSYSVRLNMKKLSHCDCKILVQASESYMLVLVHSRMDVYTILELQVEAVQRTTFEFIHGN